MKGERPTQEGKKERLSKAGSRKKKKPPETEGIKRGVSATLKGRSNHETRKNKKK